MALGRLRDPAGRVGRHVVALVTTTGPNSSDWSRSVQVRHAVAAVGQHHRQLPDHDAGVVGGATLAFWIGPATSGFRLFRRPSRRPAHVKE